MGIRTINLFRYPEEFTSEKVGEIANKMNDSFIIVSSFKKPFFTNDEFPIGMNENGNKLVRMLFRDDFNSNK